MFCSVKKVSGLSHVFAAVVIDDTNIVSKMLNGFFVAFKAP
jgi:hypothetical protein